MRQKNVHDFLSHALHNRLSLKSYHSLAFSFRVSPSLISKIILEVCDTIWRKMSHTFMPMPKTERQWKELSGQFENKWDFPHCCGAINGKHIMMIAPPRSGSLFYNYKSTYSIVLLALVDANLKFIMVDIGAYGMNNDAGIFRASKFGKAIAYDKLNLPADSCLEKAETMDHFPTCL